MLICPSRRPQPCGLCHRMRSPRAASAGFFLRRAAPVPRQKVPTPGIRARPDYRYFPASMRESRHAAMRRFWTEPPTAERRRRYQQVRDRLVKAIHEAGGKVMAGSDTPEMFLLYGFTLHRELRNIVEAGLTPYSALEAATRNPAEYLRALDRTGTVARGRRADLLLLEANPLESIANTERRAGVMVRGRWMPESELSAMRDRVAEKFSQAPSRR